MELLRPGIRIHVVGIGGIGMSAIARVLLGWGYAVSGSDQHASALTERLTVEGIPVYTGHSAENVARGADAPAESVLVVASSAIPDDNVELVEARRRGFRVVGRRELLGDLTVGRTTIAVAGTHGKTTTTAMVAWILIQAGFDPTAIVGGVLLNLGTNARSGAGPHLVLEADEYDRTFLGLHPQVAVITTLEHDHPDCYPTFDDMKDAFAEFAAGAVERGRLILCHDDPAVRLLGEAVVGRQGGPTSLRQNSLVSYGSGGDCDWQAEDVQLGGSASFEVRHRNRHLGTCALQLPGRHNVLNALAALAASTEAGVSFEVAAAALTRFRGTARRFEVKGQAAGVAVVDDYAHHPTEIRATLEAARLRYPGRPVWAVFQPHTYSRTLSLLDGFAAALASADHVVVTPVYAARETDTLGVSGEDLVTRLKSMCESAAGGSTTAPGSHDVYPCDIEYVDSLGDAVAVLLDRVQPGEVVLTMGAGDGYLVGDRVLEGLSSGLSRDRSENRVS